MPLTGEVPWPRSSWSIAAKRMCGATRREIPAASAMAAKVSDSTRLLIGASPCRDWEEPAAVAMGAPQVAFVEDRVWQRRQPLLVTLTDDAQRLIGPIDGTNLERGGLADAQAARNMITRQVL